MSTHRFYRLWYEYFIQCCKLNMILTFYVRYAHLFAHLLYRVALSDRWSRTFWCYRNRWTRPICRSTTPQKAVSRHSWIELDRLTDWPSVWVNRANHHFIFYRPLSFRAGQIYNDTLESVKNSFPQYIRELEGVADGAEVEFHKVRKLSATSHR